MKMYNVQQRICGRLNLGKLEDMVTTPVSNVCCVAATTTHAFSRTTRSPSVKLASRAKGDKPILLVSQVNHTAHSPQLTPIAPVLQRYPRHLLSP